MLQDQKGIELLLTALGEQLESLLNRRIELLVCGGAALNFLGLVQRTTEDVDILAFVTRNNEGNVSFRQSRSVGCCADRWQPGKWRGTSICRKIG